MTDLDLTEAIEAAIVHGGLERPQQTAEQVVNAVAPVVERRVRETIASDIRRLAAAWLVGWDDEPHPDVKYHAYREAWTEAGQRLIAEADRIARGGVA